MDGFEGKEGVIIIGAVFKRDNIVKVHDVKEMAKMVNVANAIKRGEVVIV